MEKNPNKAVIVGAGMVGAAVPVSYTHLDVYKRQGTARLPLTVVMPSTSKSGLARAQMRAMASSEPVSTSKMTFLFSTGENLLLVLAWGCLLSFSIARNRPFTRTSVRPAATNKRAGDFPVPGPCLPCSACRPTCLQLTRTKVPIQSGRGIGRESRCGWRGRFPAILSLSSPALPQVLDTQGGVALFFPRGESPAAAGGQGARRQEAPCRLPSHRPFFLTSPRCAREQRPVFFFPLRKSPAAAGDKQAKRNGEKSPCA